jgi:hypothetical protein
MHSHLLKVTCYPIISSCICYCYFVCLAYIRTCVASAIRSGGKYFGTLPQTEQITHDRNILVQICYNSCNTALSYCYFILIPKVYTRVTIRNALFAAFQLFSCAQVFSRTNNMYSTSKLQKITPSTMTWFFLLYMRMVYRNIMTVYPSYKDGLS